MNSEEEFETVNAGNLTTTILPVQASDIIVLEKERQVYPKGARLDLHV